MEIEQNYVSAIIHIITEDCFVDITDDVERWFDTSMMKMIRALFQ